MSDEETQRTMQFILNQQAQFATNQQKSDERISRLEDVVGRLATATLNRFESTDTRISSLSEDVDAKFAALVDSQIKTEENIRNLTAVVDHYFSKWRNDQQ